MTALYALPDHEVIGALLPDVHETHLNRQEALRRVTGSRGVVPVAIDPYGPGRVYWADIDEYPLREWQFIFTIKHLAEAAAIRSSFTTDFDVLDDEAVAADGIYPSGFIFHVSRCGSTLLAKGLARSESNLVVNQGGPLQRGLWSRLTDDFRRPLDPSPSNLQSFRRLVLALTRRRGDHMRTAFVKFISWNVLYLDFITRAFPDVPLLFLYRNPVEVIASVMHETTAALVAKGGRQAAFLANCNGASTADMTDIEYLARCYAHYFETALRGVENGLHLVNYTAITPDNFRAILETGLSLCPDAEELAVMLGQFKFHSKDDEDVSEFHADSAEKLQSVSGESRQMIDRICGDLVERLDASRGNLFC